MIKVGVASFRLRRAQAVDHNLNYGETDFMKHEIRFGELCDDVQLARTFWHEVLHAAWHEYGLNDLRDAPEERIVDALANGLVQVAQDLGYLPKRMKLDGE